MFLPVIFYYFIAYVLSNTISSKANFKTKISTGKILFGELLIISVYKIVS